MRSPIIKYILRFTLVFGLLGILGAVLLLHFFPDRYFMLYPVVPGMFYFFGWINLYIIHRAQRAGEKKGMVWIMAWRMTRFLILLLAVALVLVLCELPRLSFIIVFLSFYFCYIVLESWSYVHIGHIHNEE